MISSIQFDEEGDSIGDQCVILADYIAHEIVDVCFFQAEDGIRDGHVTGVQTCALPIYVRLLVLRRPPWIEQEGDRWQQVGTMTEATCELGELPRRVFLAVGRKELAPFVAAPQHHYVIRSVDPIAPPLELPSAEYLTMRGPFRAEDERALLKGRRIDILVSKNSGGDAGYGKIAAARALAIPVVMLRRPALPAAQAVETVEEAL